MKPQRALIIATLVTLLIGIGAVVVAATMTNPEGSGSDGATVSTELPASSGIPDSLSVGTENPTSYAEDEDDFEEREDQSVRERLDDDTDDDEDEGGSLDDDEEGDESHDDD